MTEPSTSDRRPSPRPRADATATSEPIWPSGPVQVIPVEPSDELRQLREFRLAVARLTGVSHERDGLDHERILGALHELVRNSGTLTWLHAEAAWWRNQLTAGLYAAFDTVEHLVCIDVLCPGRQVREPEPERWCSFCRAQQVIADALAAVEPAAVHVVHRDGEVLHAALDVDAARQWAADAEQDGLTLTTLEMGGL